MSPQAMNCCQQAPGSARRRSRCWRPALDALLGLPPGQLPRTRAALTKPVRSPEGKRSYLRGALDMAAGTVTPLTGQGSHQLGALALANALIVMPEKVVSMEAGEAADVMSLP